VLKRTFDLIVATVAIVTLLPLLALIAAAVRLSLGSPVLFVQTRTGLHGRLFSLIKFRTMKAAFDAGGQPLPDSDRMTWLGGFLRRSSLDELPELWNIVLGDMSLVGPRPLLPEYLGLYSQHQNRRHEVRPGLTGWAQVNGRNAVNWEDRFELDVWYVEHRRFVLDLEILLRTVATVLFQRGASPDGQVTMAPFVGSSTATANAGTS
jgi:lipopolysaccharide/colanic/teichoic acid biosynthesis glycosyltransferase